MKKDIQLAIKTINELAPAIGRYFLDKKGNLSTTAKSLYSYNFPKQHLKRQQAYKKLILRKVTRLYSEGEVQPLKWKEEQGLFLNIVEHHGIHNHNGIYSTNIVSKFNQLFLKKSGAGPIISLSTGNVPVNNFFSKRGFEFAGKHINMFPASQEHRLVSMVDKMDYNIIKRLRQTKKLEEFSKQEIDFLTMVNDKIGALDFSECERYSDQISKINTALWPLMFEQSLRNDLIDLVTLEHDRIIEAYLQILLPDEDNFIHQMLFDEKFRTLVLEEFHGQNGAWDPGRKAGTHFFWHRDAKGIQRRCYLNNEGKLEASNGFVIDFNLEEICKHLKEGSITPGMFLRFTTVMCYMGIVPFCGFGSVAYLTELKETWVKIMPDDFAAERELIANIKTDGLAMFYMGYEYDKKKDQVSDLYAFDVMYKGGFSKEYLKKIDSVSVADLLLPSLETVYQYYLSKTGKKETRKLEFDSNEIYEPLKKMLFAS